MFFYCPHCTHRHLFRRICLWPYCECEGGPFREGS